MKNIFASINWLDEVEGLGLPSDKYLAVRLRAFYQYGLNKGMESDAALSYAKERLKINIERANKEKPLVEDKGIYKKDPASIVPRVKRRKEQLSEDEILDSNVNIGKLEISKLIDRKLREIVGNVSDEEFEKVKALFKRQKALAKLTNREALEQVARITKKHRDFAKRQDTIQESVPEREPHVSDFDTSEDHNLYDFIRSMDPSNADKNLVLFKKYRSQGYRVSTALERIRKVGELREFCSANDIPIKIATRFINVYSNLEDVKKELLKWKSEGGFGLESDMLPTSRSGSGIEANPVVDYNGRQVKLKRLIQSLFSENLSARELQLMYSVVMRQIFDQGKSTDEAINYGTRNMKIIRNREIFQREFPEDPKYAESVFESFYLDEGDSFEEALRKTKEQVGRKVVSSSLVRVAMIIEEDCYWELSDKFMNYISKRI